ncbi:MAG: alkaline phosphatase [Dehalococcoidia bacterium]|nr:alkaline phosphatase [Dehalococcoidia bacterium]
MRGKTAGDLRSLGGGEARFWKVIAAALLPILLALALAACDSDDNEDGGAVGQETAASVILLIGDGMGVSHRAAARLYSGEELVMDGLPVAGMAKTGPADKLVTDSAAAATALATGVKTVNGALAVDADGEPLTTLLEMAQAAGKKTGLVTDERLVDATPAAFACHNADRSDYLNIAVDMLDHEVDVLLGGGEDYFLPAGDAGCFPDDGDRTDGVDLIEQAEAKGYETVCSETELAALDLSAVEKLLGTFGDYEMERPYSPTLADMTSAALAVLSKAPDGFFLMVEGGMIDDAAHRNDALNTLGDVLAFDEAVRVALAFQAEHPDTLVIVTADHATGGPTIEDIPQDGDCPDPSPDDARECRMALHEDGPFASPSGESFWLDWASSFHTAEDVGVGAVGPRAAELAGCYENTRIFEVMRDALGLSRPAE